MKIAICNVQEFDPTIGGIERVSVSLAEELRRQGTEILFIACRQSPFSRGYTPPGPNFFLPNPSDYSEANIRALEEILSSEHPDIVLNQNAHSLPFHRTVAKACKSVNIPLVSVLHFSPDIRICGHRNVVDFKVMPLRHNIIALIKAACTYWPLSIATLHSYRILYKELCEDCNKVILLSPSYKPIFNQILGKKSSEEKVTAICNMLSFPFDGLIPPKKKQILFCGRLYFPQKRPDRILKVWSLIQDRLPDWKLIIVGDGPHSGLFKRYASRLNLQRIKFEGFKNPVEYYKSASILAMTSNHEGFPLVLNEAMQYGCVPVAFDSFASIGDIITDGYNGKMVKPFDMRAYAETILQLATSESISSMAKNALESTKRYLPEVIGEQWLKLFESITQDDSR